MSFEGVKECAIPFSALILGKAVGWSLSDVEPWVDASSISMGSSFTTTESPAFPECRSVSLWIPAVHLFPSWTHSEMEPLRWVSLLGGVLGFFWKNWLSTELLHFWPLSFGVLHLTAEAGVFGDIGGESNCAFNNCCLEKEKRNRAHMNEKNKIQHSYTLFYYIQFEKKNKKKTTT